MCPINNHHIPKVKNCVQKFKTAQWIYLIRLLHQSRVFVIEKCEETQKAQIDNYLHVPNHKEYHSIATIESKSCGATKK